MTHDFKIQLQENIPFSTEEIKRIEAELKGFRKMISVILAFATVLVMGFIAFLMRDSQTQFKYYDYLLFVAGGFALFGFCYLIAQLVVWYDAANWKKDKVIGKNKLVSIVVGRDETEYGKYLTFAGITGADKIRLRVKPEYYSHYPIGTKLSVTYLKFSKEVLYIQADG
ncbi:MULTISPECIES: hypothetical protein [unclassified Chryseobacterium]|uniref:hypothetical protein n=1 Tax=unclassified Chryseobacterium TaxID=2593645 RepID=UPI00100C2238|nr:MULTISPECIES: hypothetical protein [unclassified Chryseobacterium]RXM53396.1 hypothetical protein BOQ64_03280 [Chryseobacterium sp. CH25]RXM65401.1 hypothetical protein BOQ60_06205 [Chryseobacterium sp. CH1]